MGQKQGGLSFSVIFRVKKELRREPSIKMSESGVSGGGEKWKSRVTTLPTQGFELRIPGWEIGGAKQIFLGMILIAGLDEGSKKIHLKN